MSSPTGVSTETAARLHRRMIAAGEARVAVFTRLYEAPIDDVWDACTNPERLRRWYAPVSGELRSGGTFLQPPMGSGQIVVCEPPRFLKLSMEDGVDEIELRLTAQDEERTVLEIQHATTLDEHEIGGQMYDAILCMGGGYYPRLVALDQLLRGELGPDTDPVALNQEPVYQPVIEHGSAVMAALLRADGSR